MEKKREGIPGQQGRPAAPLGGGCAQPVSWEQNRRLIEVLVVGVRVDTVEKCGVKQTKVTVTYRLSQPDQPMALVLPQSYSTGSVISILTEPQTVGTTSGGGASP